MTTLRHHEKTPIYSLYNLHLEFQSIEDVSSEPVHLHEHRDTMLRSFMTACRQAAASSVNTWYPRWGGFRIRHATLLQQKKSNNAFVGSQSPTLALIPASQGMTVSAPRFQARSQTHSSSSEDEGQKFKAVCSQQAAATRSKVPAVLNSFQDCHKRCAQCASTYYSINIANIHWHRKA